MDVVGSVDTSQSLGYEDRPGRSDTAAAVALVVQRENLWLEHFAAVQAEDLADKSACVWDLVSIDLWSLC